MEKLIYNDGQEPLLERAGTLISLVDSPKAHVKSAESSVISRDLIQKHQPDDRHFALHVIAMGDAENYGPNKNHDLWPASGLSKSSGTYGHHTFVRNGHFFREHNNRHPSKAIGSIKASAWNPEMHRVELIVHGDKDKAAPEYEMAKEGKIVSVSMSSRIPWDRCTICDHRAKSSSVYCDHLKKRMGQWIPEHRKFALAINDEPNFFDISAVKNPADRIAHTLEYRFSDEGKKASLNEFIFSDQLAKKAGVELPADSELGWSTPEGRQWLAALVDEENYRKNIKSAARDEKYDWMIHGVPYAFDSTRFQDKHRRAMSSLLPGQAFAKLARAQAILPFRAFFSYVAQQDPKIVDLDPRYKAACDCLPELFDKLQSQPADPEMESLCAPSDAGEKSSGGDDIDRLMDEVGDDYSVQKPKVRVRILQIRFSPSEESGNPILSQLVKASSIQRAQGLEYALAYGRYKIASLLSWPRLAPEPMIDAPILSLLISH